MQIEKTQINDRLRVSKVFRKFHIPLIYNFAVIAREIAISLKSSLLFNTFYFLFCLETKP